MKKISLVLAMLALALAVGLAFVSCNSGLNTYTITIDNAYSDRTLTRIRISVGSSTADSNGITTTIRYETVYDENITIAPGSSRNITFNPGKDNERVPGRITYWPNGTYKSVTLRDGGFYTIP